MTVPPTGAITRVATIGALVVSVAFLMATAGLVLLNWPTPTPPTMSMGGKPIELLFPLAAIEIPVLGAIISLRRGHPVGGLFTVLGLGTGLLLFALQYALYGTTTAPGAVPAAGLVGWVTTWAWAPLSACIPVLLLVFPTGRIPSARWRWVFPLTLAGAVLQGGVDAATSPGTTGLPWPSPLGSTVERAALQPVYFTGALMWSAGILGAAVALVSRARAARGDERQQLKWFALAGGFAAVSFALSTAFFGQGELGQLATGLSALAFLALPTAAGLAVLRYRLYDIDLFINRALVYTGLSAVLGGTYVAGVILFQALFRPFAIVESELSIAGSTLVVAALFQPIRRRIQDIVDRRFYRSRYDASRTLDAFTARLRADVDLDSVRADLVSVLHETVRPVHASVWLRGLRQ